MRVVVYEFPFTESVRTMLRLEHLLDRLDTLVGRDSAIDHHHALATLFEIMDVASRADLKADLIKELDRQRSLLQAWRGNPQVSSTALDEVLQSIEAAHAALARMSGRAGHQLTTNEWLMAVRSRINIPAGTCAFDLPGYHAWQQQSPERRQDDLRTWIQVLDPVVQPLRLVLALIRQAGVPHRVLAAGGQFQQSLPQGKTYQLMRVRTANGVDTVPEICGHRLLVSVRWMAQTPDGRLEPCRDDLPFELTLCA